MSDIPEQNSDQQLSKGQTYQETVRGVRTYIGWNQIPKFETSASSQDDNPFAGPRSQAASKISVKLPSDHWLGQKLEKSNLTLTEGYPSCSSDANRLFKTSLSRYPTPRGGIMCTQKSFFPFNSAFTRIARPNLATRLLAS